MFQTVIRIIMFFILLLILFAPSLFSSSQQPVSRPSSISKWDFGVSGDQPAVIIDSKDVMAVKTEGEPGVELVYAPDYLGADIERRFYIELTKIDESLPEMSIETSPSIDFLDKNHNLYHFDQPSERTNESEVFTATSNSGKTYPAVKVKSNNIRYYFKTKVRDHQAFVRFIHPKTNGSLEISLKIYDLFDMCVKHIVRNQDTSLIGGGLGDEVILPQIFPLGMGGAKLPFTKMNSSYGKPKLNPSGRALRELSEYSDESLWAVMPDSSARLGLSTVFTGHHLKALSHFKMLKGEAKVNSEDPVHGFRYYVDEDGQSFPSNDIENDDFSKGKFPDDGFVPTKFYHPHLPVIPVPWSHLRKWGPIQPLAILTFQRQRNTANLVIDYAKAYRSTGNLEYAYKGLLLLARIGLEMNFRSFMQHYRTKGDGDQIDKRLSEVKILRELSLSVLFGVGLGESRLMSRLIHSYDHLFSGLEENERKLINFLKKKDLPIESLEDVKWLIERMHLSWIQASIHKQSNFNFPLSHVNFIDITKSLSYSNSDPFLDILFLGKKGTHYGFSSADHLLDQDFTKEGIKSENIGGYNTGAINGAMQVLSGMEELKEKFPQYKNKEVDLSRLPVAIRTNIDLSLAPSIRGRAKWGMADTCFGEKELSTSYRVDEWGGHKSAPYYYGDIFGKDSDHIFLKGFEIEADPRIAWAFLNTGDAATLRSKNSQRGSMKWLSRSYDFSWETLYRSAKQLSSSWREGVRPVTSHHINILRRGEGVYERACTVGTGATGRSLYDQMELKVFGYRSHLMTRSSVASAIAENTGRTTSSDGSDMIGSAVLSSSGKYLALTDHEVHHFSCLPIERHLSSSKLTAFEKGRSSLYEINKEKGFQRRINALVDIDEKHFYVLDLYRMSGGEDHWRNITLLPTKNLKFEGISFQKYSGVLNSDTTSTLPLYVNHQNTFERPYHSKGVNGWTVESVMPNSDGLGMKVHGIYDDGSQIYHGKPIGRSKGRRIEHDEQEILLWNHKSRQEGPYCSQTLNLYEFFGGEKSRPQVESTRYLKVVGEDEDDFHPIGCEVKLPGRSDYFVFSASNTHKSMALPNGKNLEIQGRFAHVAFNDDKIIHMEIMGGKSLRCGNKRLDSIEEIHVDIVDVDIMTNLITARSLSPLPRFITSKSLKGRLVQLRRGQFPQNYAIEEVAISKDRMELQIRLHLPAVVLRSQVQHVEKNALRLNIHNVDYNHSFNGATFLSETGQLYRCDLRRKIRINNNYEYEYRFLPNYQVDEQGLKDFENDFPVGSEVKVLDYWDGDLLSISFSRSVSY